jgi:hypothetical protein
VEQEIARAERAERELAVAVELLRELEYFDETLLSGLTPAQARADEHLRMARAHLAEIAAGRLTYYDGGSRTHAESARVLVGLAAGELA